MAKKKYDKPNWPSIKREYLQANLDPDRVRPFTLQDVADKFGVTYGTVRNKSAEQSWSTELVKLQDHKVSSALQALATAEGEEEAAIRVRQAGIARKGLELASKRLLSLSPEDLSPKDAILLMKLSMEQERIAMGFGTHFDFDAPQSAAIPDFESVRENMERHTRALNLADELREFLDNIPVERALRDIDGESAVVED